MLAKKSLSDLQADIDSPHSLKKSLGALELTALGIGCIIGTGIFVLTGVAAAKHAGPGIMLSFVLAGLACAFAGLCYAEFAAMIPVAGSAYTYAYATLGELDMLRFPVRFSSTPDADFGRAAPALGEHTDAHMAGLGLAPEQIADLRKRGVI